MSTKKPNNKQKNLLLTVMLKEKIIYGEQQDIIDAIMMIRGVEAVFSDPGEEDKYKQLGSPS
jgi:hypothetical protein